MTDDTEYHQVLCPIKETDGEISKLVVYTDSGREIRYDRRVASRGKLHKRLLFAEKEIVDPYEAENGDGSE